MSSMKRVYLVKLCLCANPYLPVFFVLLASNGISRSAASTAIAIGTLAMFVGDVLTSALSDRFGPRRVVAVCGLFQAIAIGLLPSCSSVGELCWIEVMIGLTFPAMHGADSKWLRHLSTSPSAERWSHSIAWTSQLLSAAVGGMLLFRPTYACYLSAAIYVFGAFQTQRLPDIKHDLIRVCDHRQPQAIRAVLTPERLQDTIVFSLLLGTVNSVPWLLQLHASAMYTDHPFVFCLIQMLGAVLSIAGSLFHNSGTRKRVIVVLVLIIASVYIYAVQKFSSPILWLPIAAGMVLRGSVSVAARESVLAGIDSTGPVASVTMIVNAQSKVVQAVLLAILGRAV